MEGEAQQLRGVNCYVVCVACLCIYECRHICSMALVWRSEKASCFSPCYFSATHLVWDMVSLCCWCVYKPGKVIRHQGLLWSVFLSLCRSTGNANIFYYIQFFKSSLVTSPLKLFFHQHLCMFLLCGIENFDFVVDDGQSYELAQARYFLEYQVHWWYLLLSYLHSSRE